MFGTIISCTAEDHETALVEIKLDDGHRAQMRIPLDKAKRYPLGREIELFMRPRRKSPKVEIEYV